MESLDSSPNCMKAKKDFSPVGSECDGIVSLTSSSTTCGSSSVNGPHHTPKLNTNGTKKKPKSFKSIQSFRRRAKSRTVGHRPTVVAISDVGSVFDPSESSPSYLKSTSCSQGKKTDKPSLAMSRTPSFRNVRILVKKASFKTKRGSLSYSEASEDVGVVSRATHSSTLKGSKFPDLAEREEMKPGAKVCRYHHCSLHGHCRGDHDPAAQTKRFLYNRRRSLRRQKSLVPKTEPEKRSSDKRKDSCFRKSEMVSIAGQVDRDENGVERKGMFGGGYENSRELIEGAFGETSFPERSYQENLELSRKYSLFEQEFRGVRLGQHRHCLTCTCRRLDNKIPRSGFADLAKRPNEVVDYIQDIVTSSRAEEKANNEDVAEAPVIYGELTEKNIAFSASSSSPTPSDLNYEGEGDSKTESTPAADFKLNEVVQVHDSETNSGTQAVGQLHFSKPRHISMWNLIHERMTSNLAAFEGERPVDGENSFLARESSNSDSETGNDSENQEIVLRKMYAVKLVREAIEKILLPEVQDQSSDDQSSVSSESTPRAEILERNQTEAFTEENLAEANAADEDGGNKSAEPKQEGPIIDKPSGPEIKKIGKWFAKKSENKAPKHWSNLKKWILLQKFIRELEKVKKFNPKKPQLLPLNPDPEAEKVNLRHLAADGRKNSEEWMLDYALRQAVGQLAPTQKKKVALLVRAFETVAPIKEDEPPQAQYRITRLKSDESVFAANQDSGLKETGKPLPVTVSGDYGESSKKFQECIISSPSGEGKIEESSQMNHIKMWHMIYQHVVSGIAEKVGSQLLNGSEDDEAEDNISPKKKSHGSSRFTKSDALKLVKEAVDEILLPENQEDWPGTQNGERSEVPKAKNWSKLKRLILLKKSIRALEKARTVEPQEPELVPHATDHEPEKIELKRQMMDEKKKAEQWMLDYAVQHIVTKLTPDRKRKVCMLVEAFEAIVPLPGM